MTEEMKTAITRLKKLPPAAQGYLGPKLNEYLNKLHDLQDTIQASRDSGPGEPLTKDQLLARIHSRHKDLL